MDSLKKLHACGQSYWLDNLTRKKIKSGELQKRMQEQGLRGITSNPAIFDKAISKSEDYNEQIESLAKATSDPVEAYESLVIQDIQDACDILKPVYEESNGVDGYVSLEVSPHLARDTEGTINEARRLFHMVQRPNCMIKIPGTAEGLPAVEQMLYEGININITLLFSVKVYEDVARTYLRALQRRSNQGLPIDHIGSVASFFLSRIDVLIDQLLKHRLRQSDENFNVQIRSLYGKVAVAYAKTAYRSFLSIFKGKQWEKLQAKGAMAQRPLWASTSTKNPAYSDVMYVEPLIGDHTVNTLPDETVEAFGSHGKVVCGAVLEDLDDAARVLQQLEALGIDIDFVTQQLVNEGIQKFIDPFDELIRTISGKMKR